MAGIPPNQGGFGFDPNRPQSAPAAAPAPVQGVNVFNPAAAAPSAAPQPQQAYAPGEKPDHLKGYRGPNFMGVVRPPMSTTASGAPVVPPLIAAAAAPPGPAGPPGFDPTAFFKAAPAAPATAPPAQHRPSGGPPPPTYMSAPPVGPPTGFHSGPPSGSAGAPPAAQPAYHGGFAAANAGPPSGGGPPMGGMGGMGGPPTSAAMGPPRGMGGPPTVMGGPPAAQAAPFQTYGVPAPVGPPMEPPGGYGQHAPVGPPHYMGAVAASYPGVSGFGAPAPGPAQPLVAPTKLNSSDMPRPTTKREDDDDGTPKRWVTSKGGAGHRLPPSSLSKFVVVDGGNCSPRAMRTTLNQLPNTADLLAASNLPMGVIIQPLALGVGEEAPPTVDHGLEGPLRCGRCRAYMNGYMQFMKGGQQFQCNLCGHVSETPTWYFAQTDGTGQRYDANERPELSKGTVDYVCSSPVYETRPPTVPGLVFLLDVSPAAIQSGFLHYSALAVKDAVAELVQVSPEARVGVITYSSSVQFYNLRQGASQPLMYTVGVVDDMFAPLPSTELVVPVMEFQWNIDVVLDALPGVVLAEPLNGHAFGAAMKGAICALEGLGGKVIAFSSSLTSKGPGTLAMRDNPQLYGTDKEKTLFACADKFYEDLGRDCVSAAVGVDMYICTQPGQYVDLASVTAVSRLTSGQVHLFSAWNAVSDGMKLRKEVLGCAVRDFGFDGMMKLRCSKGMRIGRYLGHFHSKNIATYDVPTLDNYTTFAATIEFDGQIAEAPKNEAYLQFACLYTTRAGQRRVRVHNLALPVTTSLSNVFKTTDLDAIMSLLARTSAAMALEKPLPAVRDQLVSVCVNSLYAYRKYCATSSQSGQLILPEPLMLYPLYTLALMKSAAFRHDQSVRTDERIFSMGLFNVLPPDQLLGLLYPRMYSLHNVQGSVGHKGPTGQIILPTPVSLSSENLTSEGAFLLSDGLSMFLWLGGSINPNFLRDVFGVDHVENVNYDQVGWVERDTELSKQVTNIIHALSEGYCFYPKLRILKKSDSHESRFFSYLLEDKSHQSLSYVDFLVHCHRGISAKISGGT